MSTRPLINTAKRGLFLAANAVTPWLQSLTGDRLWVLMYHRVLPADDPRYVSEEPGMVVTPETFRQHLHTLKSLFTVVSLSDWIARRQAGKPLPRRACAITFDDGWLDNFQHALPILEQTQVPATLFAVSGMIGTSLQFWPNRIARLIGNNADWQQHEALNWVQKLDGEYTTGFTDREKLGHIIAKLKQLPDSELTSRLDVAERQLGITPKDAPALMDWDQLRTMQDTGLVDIGSHTCHHFRLTEQLPAEILEHEIVESRKELERQLQRPVPLFCFPNGDASPLAIRLVQQHYVAAVTTRRGINTSDAAAHELLRIGIHEHISDTPLKLRAKLSGWL